MNGMRMIGMASGMDINQIMKDLMRAERMPLDNLTKQRQILEWQRDDYREMNLILTKFRDNIFDGVLRRANMTSKTVASSNSSRVTATATANAGNATYTISRVTQLASAAHNSSAQALSADPSNKINPSQSLWSNRDKFAGDQASFNWQQEEISDSIDVRTAGTRFKLKHGGVDNFSGQSTEFPNGIIRADGKDFKVFKSQEEYDNSTDANKVLVNTGTGDLTFNQTLRQGSKIEATYNHNFIEFEMETHTSKGVERENFKISGADSLNSMMDKINRSKLGLNVFYDDFSDRITMTRTETGNFNQGGNEIKFTGTFLTDVLHLKNDHTYDANNNVVSGERGGENAKFTINGLETERPTNNFTINGVNFTLRDTFTDNPVNLTVNTDTDRIFDTIKAFVDEYNEMIDKINGKLTEERHRDFKPLTSEEREAMSEREAEMWEEKARSGMLRNDRILSNGLDRMRVDIYSPVAGDPNSPFKQLTSIGIRTTSNFMDRGKLEINEDRLRAAIEQDPEAVFQLFAADGATNGEKGIARRMRESLATTRDQVIARAGAEGRLNHQFTLGRNISNIDNRISNFERRLQQVEDRYWRQFTAMEKAMYQANNQAESLFAALFGGQ